MTRIRLGIGDDAAAIAAIHNVAIAERSATFDTRPRSVGDTALRIADAGRHPILVATDDQGTVIGWAGLGGYRARECYDGIAEVSVYLAGHARGRGIGRQLLAALMRRARELGHWKLLSRVFLFNTASRALCPPLGPRRAGEFGTTTRLQRRERDPPSELDGRWLDVVIVERLLLDDAPGDRAPAHAARLQDAGTDEAPNAHRTAAIEPRRPTTPSAADPAAPL